MPSPSRRRLLRSLVALGAGSSLAGCNEFATGDATTADGTSSEPGPETGAALEVTRESYVATAWSLHGTRYRTPKGSSVLLEDLEPPVRDAVGTAIESPPFSTTDPSNALLDGIDDVELVEVDGTVWTVEHTFPTATVRLDRAVPDGAAPPERTVAHDSDAVEESEAIEALVRTIATLTTHSEPRPHETTRLHPDVEAFLERYDYLETPSTVGEIVVSRTDRAPPYTVRAREASDEEIYGHRLADADHYGRPTRSFLRRVVASDRRTPVDYSDHRHTIYPKDVPRPFARDLAEGIDTVRVDGTVYEFRVRHVHWEDVPVSVDATVEGSGATGPPVDIELSVTNPGDTPVGLVVPGVSPFGVLWAYGPGGEHVLWNEGYDRTDDVVVEEDAVVPDSTAATVLDPGTTRTATYRLGHGNLEAAGPLEPGTYEVLGTLRAKWATYDGQPEDEWAGQFAPYTLAVEVA